MSKQWTESEYRTKTLLTIAPMLFFVLIVILGIIKNCTGNGIAPMDNDIRSSRKIVEHLNVLDSTYNGFRVVYATKNNVSEARLEEIQSRPHIRTAFKRLQADAPPYFGGSLLETDIYDFAGFALRYDPDPDIELHNIFVSGHEKSALYIGKNLHIDNPAYYFDTRTEQGIQYLSHDDIYYRRRRDLRIYRYWKCCGNNQTSKNDERFSHFSEEERIW
ncbi:MAG: hypothetical protein LBC19_04420 [Tannerella sp.]|nr:hypothetical protein [Tannerella sp.]